MSYETSKMRDMRTARGDFNRYLHGHGIDIGCGGDKLAVSDGTVDGWDKDRGDAQLLEGIQHDTYNFVYSSHCLEHLREPVNALIRWSEVLKVGGILYIVVPDYDLYEGAQWPSRFNSDHKCSFSLWRNDVNTHPHYYTPWMAHGIRRYLQLIELRLEDYGYEYAVGATQDQTLGSACAQICYIAKRT